MLNCFKNGCVIECEADRFAKTSPCFSRSVNGCRSRPRSRNMTSAILGRHPRQTNDQMPTSQRIWASPNPMVAMHPSNLQSLDQPCDISGCPIQSLLSSEVVSVLPIIAAGLPTLVAVTLYFPPSGIDEQFLVYFRRHTGKCSELVGQQSLKLFCRSGVGGINWHQTLAIPQARPALLCMLPGYNSCTSTRA